MRVNFPLSSLKLRLVSWNLKTDLHDTSPYLGGLKMDVACSTIFFGDEDMGDIHCEQQTLVFCLTFLGCCRRRFFASLFLFVVCSPMSCVSRSS